jgi:hypothetical protein
MSRYTRMLRKQAKAAAKAGHNGVNFPANTSTNSSPALGELHSGGPSSGVVAPGTNGSRLSQPIELDHSSVQNGSGQQGNKVIPSGLAAGTPAPAGSGPAIGSPQPARPTSVSPHLEGWIWPGKIRTGELVVLVGESGAGASTLTADWIARLTRGMSFPGCRPQDHHPVAEVLLFNALEDYARTVLPRLAEMGGDPRKVLLASDQLLAWGAGEVAGDQPPLEGREAQTRVRLHTTAALEKLDQLLKRRPNIRLVVIDQLKLFLRTDSERVFEGLVHELTTIARRHDVTLVLTQAPDAFRKSGGPARYLKSASLVQCARSIWRLVSSEEDPFGDRVLDCLKLSHPVRKEKPGPWHLRLPAFGPLEWVRGNGGALLASTATSHEQALKTACRMVERVLQVSEGTTTWDLLVKDANAAGIELRWLREAIYKMNLESSFDLQRGQEKIERTIGYAEEMVSRQSAADFNHSLSREELALYKQRQLDPPLRWGDEQPDWDERFAEVAQDTSRVPHQNVFPEDLEVQKATGSNENGPVATEEPAEVPAGEALRFNKPKLVAKGSEGVATGVWDDSTDLAEGDEEVAGWEDDVSTPTGHLAGAV